MKYILSAFILITLYSCGPGTKDAVNPGNVDSTANLPIVTTEKLSLQPFEHFFQVQGVIHSDEVAMVNPETGGIYKSIAVKVGDKVNAGQIIAIINTDIMQSNLQELKKNLEMANFVFEKQKNLWDQKIGSELQFIEAKTRKESLEQSVKTMETQISKGIIKVPFTGIIDEVFVKQGELANPAMPVARVINLDNMYVVAEVPESYLAKVKVGNPVKVTIDALNYSSNAKISRMGRYIESNNRTFKIQIDLDNKDQLLVPNLIASVHIRDFVRDSSVAATTNNIIQDAKGNSFVYILSKNEKGIIAKKTTVAAGLSYNGKTLILEGLTGTEEIVAEGARNINDNDVVMVK